MTGQSLKRFLSLDVAASSLRFRRAFDREVETAVLFVLEEQGRIAAELDDLARRRAAFADTAVRVLLARPRATRIKLGELHEEYSGCAHAVIRLLSFVDLNATAVRKILKKHDKMSQHALTHVYVSASSDESAESHLDQLHGEEGLKALVVSLRRAFAELHRVEVELLEAQTGGRHRPSNSTLVGGAARNHRRHRSAPFPAAPAPDFGEEARITAAREPLLLIQLSRERLRRNTRYVDVVAAGAMIFGDAADDGEGPEDSDMTFGRRASSLLILLSTFLYMTNYYVVAPSLGDYLAVVSNSDELDLANCQLY